MRRKPYAAAAALVLALSAPAAAQTSAAASQSPEVHALREKALQLARLVAPQEQFLDEAKLASDFEQGMLADQEMRDLEKEHPGIIKAMWVAATPEVLKQTDARLPALWEELANIYVAKLSIAELETASAFFASATGRKMVRLLEENIVQPVLVSAAATETAISSERLAQAKDTAAKKMVSGLSVAEQQAIVAFGQSPAGGKLLALGPQVSEATVAWLNASDPEGEARLMAVMEAAVEKHMAAASPAESKAQR